LCFYNGDENPGVRQNRRDDVQGSTNVAGGMDAVSDSILNSAAPAALARRAVYRDVHRNPLGDAISNKKGPFKGPFLLDIVFSDSNRNMGFDKLAG
jgi:hypothetical protein